MAPIDVISADRTETAPAPRFGSGTSPNLKSVCRSTHALFSDMDKFKRDAKGSIKTAIDALAIAASLTQNLPYLGAVSSALTVFLKIQDVGGLLLP